MLPHGRPFRLASDLDLASVDYREIPRAGGIARLGGGGTCFIAGGHFGLGGGPLRGLLDVLAPLVHLRGEAERATLRWSLERMRHELF